MANSNSTPLTSLDDWEDDLRRRYPEESKEQDKAAFRNYRAEARPGVREFYRLNHEQQTVEFVRAKRAEFLRRDRRKMGAWEALEYLNTLVDDSDPDTELSQLEHLLQTAEAIRHDGHPRWFIATGLVHDLGKMLCLFGEPQWAVVGDTYPVGCAFSEKIVVPEFFAANPDQAEPAYQSRLGMYEEGCGLDNVLLSWGHDEYLYHVVRDCLPDEGLAMIRYHSCYPVHREGEYDYLLSARDRELITWVRAFNPYDLYTKRDTRPNVAELKPFYDDLLAEFFPEPLRW